MAGNKTVYTLDLDTSKLISKYKDAISQMEKAGVSGDITKGLTQGLEKLEKEYKNLETAGKAGFTNSKQIENFQKRVEKLMTSFRGFESELGGVSKKIGDVAKKSSDASKKLSGAFSKFGFKDVAKQMDAINNATDREAKLGEIVKAELQARAKAVADLKVKYDQAAQAAAQASQKASSTTLGTNQSSKYSSGESIWTGGKNKVDNSVKQAIVEQAKAIAKAAKDGETAWAEFNNYLKANGLEKAFNQRALGPLEQTIKDMQAGFSAAAPAIEEADRALEELNAAEQRFNQIGKNTKDGVVARREAYNQLRAGVNEVERAETGVSEVMEDAKASSTDMANAQNQAARAANDVAGAAISEESAVNGLTSNLQQTVETAEKTASTFDKLKSRVLMFFSVTSIFNSVRNEIKKTYEDVKQLDKSFASIAMVTEYSVNEMWSSYSQYADMAAQLGQKTNDIIQASALFYQQGLNTNEALELTTDTMKLATLAGNDFQTATQEMTSAIRGFKMEMDEGNRVADVYSNLAAHAAATVDDIAQAMARTASIANSAGMSFENTSAFLTQMIETTQESAENIGTSLKTIIARFTELKENVAGTADSEFEDLDYNKVDKALKSVGVSLKDATGQFRNLDEVFLELSKKWDTLDRNTQRYVATIAAGSRQQSRFIAMMDNYERTAQLMEYAADAEGKADEQFAKYADTMEYKLNQLSTAWEEFRVKIANSDFFKGFIDNLTKVVNFVSNIKTDGLFNKAKLAGLIPLAIWGAKTFATTFISTFQKNLQLAKSIKKDLGNLIKLKTFKIKFELDPKDVARTKNTLDQIDLKTKALKANKVILKVDSSQLNGTITDVDVLKKAYEEMGMSSNKAAIAARVLNSQLQKQGLDIQSANAAMQQYKATIVSGGISQGLSAIGSAGASAFAMIASGMKAADVAKFFIIQTATMAAQYAIQAAMAKAHEALMKKIKIKSGAGLVAAEARNQAGVLATQLAGAATQEAAAGASGLATGTALSEGFIAGTAGIGAIVLAITAAITAIGFGIAALIKSSKNGAKSAQEQLEEAEKAAKEAQKIADGTKESKKSAQESAESAQELRKEYEKLASKVYRTNEEQERYEELVKQIRDELPEVVIGYNKITGELTTQNKIWDEIIEKAKYLANQANHNNYVAQLAKIAADEKVAQRKYDVKTEDAQNNLDVLSRIINQRNVFTNGYNGKTVTGFSTTLNNYRQQASVSGDYSELEREDFKKIAKQFTQVSTQKDYGEWMNSIIDDESNDIDYIRKMFVALSQMNGDTINDLSAESKLFLEGYQNSNQTFINEQQEILDETISANEDLVNAQRAIMIKDELGVSENVANFMADMLKDPNIIDHAEKSFRNSVGSTTGNGVEDKQYWDNAEEMYNYTKGSHGGYSDNLHYWDTIVGEVDEYGVSTQEVFDRINEMIDEQQLNIDKLTESAWNEARTDDEAWAKFAGDGGALSYYNQAYQDVYETIMAKEKALSESEQQAVEKFYSNIGNSSVEQLENYKTELINAMDSKEDKDYAEEKANKFIEELNQKVEGTAKKTGINKSLLSDWTENQLKGLESAFDTLSEKSPEGAEKFTNSVMDALKNNPEMTKEQMLQMFQIPWDEMDISNATIYTNKIVDILKDTLGKEKAKEIAENFVKEATKAGIASFGVKSQETIDAIVDQIEDGLEKTVKAYSGISSIIKSQLEDGFISFSQSQEFKKAIQEMGKEFEEEIDPEQFLVYNDDGTINLKEEELTKFFRDRVNDQDKILEMARKETEAKIEELEIQKDQINAEYENLIITNRKLLAEKQITLEKKKQIAADNSYDSAAATNVHAAKGDTAWLEERQKTLDDIEATEKAITDIQTENNNAYKEKEARISELNSQISDYQTHLNQIVPGSKEYIEVQQKMKAAERELLTERYNQIKTGKDLNELEKEKIKTAEEEAKALEDVAKKQQDLNDKIKEYNELLYGKANRKSTLDVLYNYNEAINSFSDEISRSKEILSDSKSLEESALALTHYTQATHNLLVEEKAKQEILKKGLANYEDVINKGTSYYDSENGVNVDVDFSSYVKKDDRTGKYMLDQRLLNEAKFADTWKDYLEEQVSNYNKYSEDLLKSEDNVRKQEKELEDERNDARKKYVAMEQEIADVLKQQYQDEVDALQSKYDSMKDADDDYLDALQEAIDKQRQLRDQENAYEDLAKQEKKLSLMQRDTSGANALEVQKLEEDVQKSREDLLDEAIDNVIEGLEKLYEKQEELREEEMELKQALLDNTLYWNQQAENLAQSFNNADEYAAYLSSISKEYADMTLTMQQDKLAEYGDTYTQATEYMAMISMDSASETHDFINDTVTTTGEEINQVVTDTAETFSTEVIRSYNETAEAFNQDMQKAKQAIDDANKSLEDAIKKYNECAQAANEAAEAYNRALAAQVDIGGGGYTYEPEPEPEPAWKSATTLYGLANSLGINGHELDDMSSKLSDEDFNARVIKMLSDRGLLDDESIDKMLELALKEKELNASKLGYEFGINGMEITEMQKNVNDQQFRERILNTLKSRKKFATGGLVDYTGPAWVDGQPDRPEAFLSAEDTENIGNAARILADIPWLDRTTSNGQVITNNGGDVSVEINLNIDHISSETDIDEMLERVKEEIVEVARPAGTNTILQQEI